MEFWRSMKWGINKIKRKILLKKNWILKTNQGKQRDEQKSELIALYI